MQPWRGHVLVGAAKGELCAAVQEVFDAEAPGHRQEVQYYPDEFFEPYLSRRRKIGWDLYGLLGIARGETAKMRAQHRRNFQFFDAPVGMVFTVHRELATGSWLDYGMFLEKFPPEYECEIEEDTSWSCAHGVERWRSNCGCNGGRPFNQLWRAPLRQALDELRDGVAPLTEQEGNKLFKDVWAARDGYIDVVLNRAPEQTEQFFKTHQQHELSEQEQVRALELMEMQRHTQLMYTSCGWFFDDIGGIETVQIIAYAARVIQLARLLFGQPGELLEQAFLARMAEAKSNEAKFGDGAQIYRSCALTMELGLEQVAAHYAISSVFSSFAEETELFCYRVKRISFAIHSSGRGRLAPGQAGPAFLARRCRRLTAPFPARWHDAPHTGKMRCGGQRERTGI